MWATIPSNLMTVQHLTPLVSLPSFKTLHAMEAQQTLPQVPKVKFWVLIIGRVNAGKTLILQRLVDTTDSPEIYKLG